MTAAHRAVDPNHNPANRMKSMCELTTVRQGGSVAHRLLSFAVFLTLHSLTAGTQASDPRVIEMGDRFVSTLPTNWSLQQGSWQYFDVANCFANGPTCYGSNPSSPYGFPVFFDSVSQKDSWEVQMNPSDAVVIFMRTPGEMRYFGLTQYLMTRAGGSEPIFGSLSDTTNHLKFKTIESSNPGNQVFDQLAVVVWTADLNTFASIQSQLAAQGIPEDSVNLIPLPIELPIEPLLKLGIGAQADAFNMLFRMALPTVPEDLQSYIHENPFYVLKVGPLEAGVLSPAPIIGYGNEISGVREPEYLRTALNSLAADVKTNYRRNFSFKDSNVIFGDGVGWDCFTGHRTCNGDNHDALYSFDTKPIVVNHLSDVVVVVGVNHKKTGKALYVNHALYDIVRIAGISSISDPMFTSESALYHAGVKSLQDPRVARYKDLYAYVISYQCGQLEYCLNIPAPAPENPVGLEAGAPFFMMGRSYVEPRTKVRPSLTEIIPHQVMIGSFRTQ
jgi:hypothetical protein